MTPVADSSHHPGIENLEKGHPFDPETGRAAAERRWQLERERRDQIERQVVEYVASQVMECFLTYAAIRDSGDEPASARLTAAARIEERYLGKVGDKLEVTGAGGGPVELRRADTTPEELAEALEELGLVKRRELEQ